MAKEIITGKGNSLTYTANRYANRNKDGYGEGGLAGIKYNDWLGYENTTRGMAVDVLNRLNTQNGIQATDPGLVGAREPFRQGRFFVKWLKIPPFFTDRAAQALRAIFEDMVKEVGGVPENSISSIDVENGPTKATSSYFGMYKEDGNSVNLKVSETAGSMVRKFIDYWLSGAADRKTNVCHMYGKRMAPISSNLTGSLIYVLLGPDCRPETIEFACMWHNIMPYKEQTSHLNSSLGDVGSGVELDVEFKGTYDRGPEIDILARKLTEAYNLYGQSFLNQYMPAYLYDAELFSTDWRSSMSINIDDRLEGIIKEAEELNIDPEKLIYNKDIVKSRKDIYHSHGENEVIQLKSNAKTLAEMGIVSDNGFVESIELLNE